MRSTRNSGRACALQALKAALIKYAMIPRDRLWRRTQIHGSERGYFVLLCGVVIALGLSWPNTAFSQTSANAEQVERMIREVGQLYQQGHYPEALTQAKQALELAEKILGPDHPVTAISMNNLGALYHAMGQYEQALPMWKRALAINEKVLGPEHPETVISVNNLGVLYHAMGQYEQVLPMWKRTLAINEKVLGPEHPDTAKSVNNLGGLYYSMGQYDQALPLHARASDLRENPRPRASGHGDKREQSERPVPSDGRIRSGAAAVEARPGDQ
jgi:tetratricopeptide (TPR) repeat protein